MRCYFHLVNGSEEMRDRAGLEVAVVDRARAEAIQALAKEDRSSSDAWAGWRLNVSDASGAIPFLDQL